MQPCPFCNAPSVVFPRYDGTAARQAYAELLSRLGVGVEFFCNTRPHPASLNGDAAIWHILAWRKEAQDGQTFDLNQALDIHSGERLSRSGQADAGGTGQPQAEEGAATGPGQAQRGDGGMGGGHWSGPGKMEGPLSWGGSSSRATKSRRVGNRAPRESKKILHPVPGPVDVESIHGPDGDQVAQASLFATTSGDGGRESGSQSGDRD